MLRSGEALLMRCDLMRADERNAAWASVKASLNKDEQRRFEPVLL